MRVFDDGRRDLPGAADHLVSHFDYLNTSDRIEAERVRDVIENMFQRYPAKSKHTLRRRLRSIDDITHLSAFFELVLHNFLLRQDLTVIDVEPKLQNTPRSPDFLVETGSGERFYLEATLATGRSRDEDGANRRLREALQAIDSVHSADFFLDLRTSGMPTAPVSSRRLRRRLQQWLDELDYEQVVSVSDGNTSSVPVFHYEQHDAHFRISPVPRRRSRGTTQRGRAIGGRMLPALSVQPHEPIRNSIARKATRYRQLDAPYVVAVNAIADYADAESAIDALFGTPAVFVRRTPNGIDSRQGRDTNGVWRGPGGPINTRVSAVISTERLTPWSLGQRRARLILNPCACHPLADAPFGIDIVEVQDERLHTTPGSSFEELFGLPEGWPE